MTRKSFYTISSFVVVPVAPVAVAAAVVVFAAAAVVIIIVVAGVAALGNVAAVSALLFRVR